LREEDRASRCNVWPPDLYAAMETYFPPAAAMEAAKLSPNRNKKGFSAAVGP